MQIINKACPMLATIAEEGKAMSNEGRQVIKEYMHPFKKHKIDKIILGCTHYPIYEKLIRDELQYDVELINTGTTVANYVNKIITDQSLQNTTQKDKEYVILTKPKPYFKNIAKNILNFEIIIK